MSAVFMWLWLHNATGITEVRHFFCLWNYYPSFPVFFLFPNRKNARYIAHITAGRLASRLSKTDLSHIPLPPSLPSLHDVGSGVKDGKGLGRGETRETGEVYECHGDLEGSGRNTVYGPSSV